MHTAPGLLTCIVALAVIHTAQCQPTAEQLIDELGLAPLVPEGGFLLETFRLGRLSCQTYSQQMILQSASDSLQCQMFVNQSCLAAKPTLQVECL